MEVEAVVLHLIMLLVVLAVLLVVQEALHKGVQLVLVRYLQKVGQVTTQPVLVVLVLAAAAAAVTVLQP
jgi:hypothetical protein